MTDVSNDAYIARTAPAEPVDEDMPPRIWAGDFNASGFGHAVAGPQGGLYEEYVRADLAAPPSPVEGDVERLRAALTPSAEIKAAYIGEFSFHIEDRDEDGNECQRKVSVPWTTIKEIMAAIRDRAGLASEGKTDA